MTKRRQLPQLFKTYRLYIAAGLIVSIGLAAIAVATRPSTDTIRSASPNFSALVPAGKTPDWKQSKPSSKNSGAVYIYSDEISGVPIKVSQQPLPPSFQDDPAGKVAEIAQGFNATSNMQVDGLPVYIGTSSKGPQSVIFSDNTLLVLIKSDGVIATGAWADYIKMLKKT